MINEFTNLNIYDFKNMITEFTNLHINNCHTGQIHKA